MSTTDHLANERTFLAWVRTGIGIMAFGFVIEKFALFLKQISFFVGKEDLQHSILKNHMLQGLSPALGVFLISFGVILCLLAFFQFIKIRKCIEENVYKSSIWLNAILTSFMLFVGIFLVVYLSGGF